MKGNSIKNERSSIEEYVKILERFSNENVIYGSTVGMTLEKYKDLQLSAEHILSDYKRVLKENEELKNDYENLSNSVVVKNHCIKNSIPVQKVKDKIEEYKKEKNKFGNCLVEFYENELADRDIKILQELLEKRK